MKKQNIKIKFVSIFLVVFIFACSDYLDVVPDNIATIDQAFNMRSTAEKYLFTCYSYMPNDGDANQNPAYIGGDEIWGRINNEDFSYSLLNISRGFQNKVNPYGDQFSNLYKGLRDCNIFIENIDKVPDLEYVDKIRWIAEVKFLKAYYHFSLIRMYGPIPLIKESLPINASVEQAKVSRNTIDECFNYVVDLLDEAMEDLPDEINDPAYELGRITKPIAMALKAKVLVTAASPLFNGDSDFSHLKNNDGTSLFDPEVRQEKWDKAVIACKEAINFCEEKGYSLYYYKSVFNRTDTVLTQLSIRNVITERWNNEIIWANTQSQSTHLQTLAGHRSWDPLFPDNLTPYGTFAAPLKIVELFYSDKGVPINEDKSWEFNERYQLREGDREHNLYIKEGYKTAKLNFNREPRFYANLGFDGGIWYGQGYYDDKKPESLLYITGKAGQLAGYSIRYNPITGYSIKKVEHFENTHTGLRQFSITPYPMIIIRLADLYLLYAEALNESLGPVEEAFYYLDLIRERAGLEPIKTSWAQYSLFPDKFSTQNGLREIIHQERLIELSFEGQRFWDLRRWKKALSELNKPIKGWNVQMGSEETYYQPVTIWQQKFGMKDYFWPIRESYLTENRNLVQSLGW